MKNLCLWLPAWFLFVVVVIPRPAFCGSSPLKILELNFNSEEVPNDPDYYVRDKRFKGLVQWIQQNSPDVILLAEAWSYRNDHSVAFTLARAIGYDLAYRLEMGFPHLFYEADAVLAKKSLQMSGERDLKLPHSALEIGDGKTWVVELGAVSYAVGVKMQLADGEPLYLYTMHLTGSTVADKNDQAQAVLADAQAWTAADGVDWQNAHVILGGDLNSPPTDPAVQNIVQAGFTDSFAQVHPGDTSCSDCELPTQPWYNPFALAAGQLPSQADENSEMRDDYVFIHSSSYQPLSSTLIFTEPWNGVWMSDHYGVFSIFGGTDVTVQPGPTHDSSGDQPATQMIELTDDLLQCPGSVYPDQPPCVLNFGPVNVSGARGITVSNQSNYYVDFAIDGPGYIFATKSTGLNPGDQATFTFNSAGEFPFSMSNTTQVPGPSGVILKGSVQVLQTGY